MLGGKLRVVPKHPFTHERRGGECYRTVAWGLADKLFLNIQNLNQLLDKTHGKGCFSPIVRSAADVVRSVMGVPYVRGPLPVVSKLNTTGGFVEVKTVLPLRVVFMKRSQGEVWTRHQGMRGLANQDEVIDFLRRKCKKNGLEFEALEFYYTDMKNAQEQVWFWFEFLFCLVFCFCFRFIVCFFTFFDIFFFFLLLFLFRLLLQPRFVQLVEQLSWLEFMVQDLQEW